MRMPVSTQLAVASTEKSVKLIAKAGVENEKLRSNPSNAGKHRLDGVFTLGTRCLSTEPKQLSRMSGES